MYRRFIVPLDGSELAESILPHVAELAKRFDAEVVLLRAVTSEFTLYRETAVVEMPRLSQDLVERRQQSESRAADQYLEAMRGRLESTGVRTWKRVVQGPAAAAIIEAAEQETEPVVVAMSTHGRGGLGRFAFGSVADDVLRNVRVPVFLLRPQQ